MAYGDFADTTSRSRRGEVNPNLGAKPIAATDTGKDAPSGSNIAQLYNKVGAVANQTSDIVATVAGAGAHFVANTPKYVKEDVYPFLKGIASTVTGEYSKDLANNKKQQDQLDRQTNDITQLYRAGKISKDNYAKMLRDISASYQDLSKDSQSIASKTDRGNVLESAFMTGADILSAGSLQLGAVGGKQVAEAGGKQAIKVLMDEGATNLEKAILKFPVVRDLVERNLASAGTKVMSESLNQYLFREGKSVAAGYLFKRPVFYQANLGQAEKTYADVIHGNYSQAAKDASWLGMQMIKGGPLGGAAWLFGMGKNITAKLAHGNASLIDELSSRIGNGSRTQIADLLDTVSNRNPAKAKEYEDALKVMQESSKRVYGSDVIASADNLMHTFMGQDAKNITARDWLETQLKWKQADDIAHEELQKLVQRGAISEIDAAKFTPVRWDAGMRNAAAEAIQKAGPDPEAQLTAVKELGERMGFANNQNLMNQIQYEIQRNAGGTGDAVSAVREIDAAVASASGGGKELKDRLAKLGYVLAEPAGGRGVTHIESEGLPKLVSEAAKGNVDLFDSAIAPQPQVHAIAGFISKIGLSPEATTRLANQELTKNVVAGLDSNLNIAHDFTITSKDGNVVSAGQAVMTTLQNYIENLKGNKIGRILTAGSNEKAAITDLRQLHPKEIIEALSTDKYRLTTGDARQILHAINQAYYEVPMSLRGAGDHFVDWLYKVNPAHKYYSRIQSAFRYTYNPFFRVQESTETFLGAGLTGGNRIKAHLLFNTTREELDNVVKTLDDARIFTSSLYGEGAQDVVLGRITANITQGQKRDLAGLAMDIASKRGLSVEQMVAEHPDEINDALRVIVQYPQKGFLASPMSRTLNLLFFPMRYNLKVTAVAAGVLAKEPPVVQTAVIHSLFKLDEYLKSDEGIKWQSQHADAIQVFNWLTPINSIEYTLSLLNGTNSLGDLGNLGGLPIGVISQVLDSLGIIHLNTPYVNPKTGDVLPKYIPKTVKAQAATALGDLLGTMFTYPGRTLGLPGKQQTINTVVKKFIDTNGTEFDKQLQDKNLTPLQQNWVRVLKGDTSPEAIDSLYNSPTPGGFNYYTLPPLATPEPVVTPRENLPTKASLKKGKRPKPVAQPIH